MASTSALPCNDGALRGGFVGEAIPDESRGNHVTLSPDDHRGEGSDQQALGPRPRGLLQDGLAGDVVIFDPATVGPGEKRVLHDFPGGEARLSQHATGIKATIVNGELMTLDGAHQGGLSGRLLGSVDYRD